MAKSSLPTRYVVGYIAKGNCVYGKDSLNRQVSRWLDPFTLRQAQRCLKNLPCARGGIFKLVRVKGSDGKKRTTR